jgi:hypothetical protein
MKVIFLSLLLPLLLLTLFGCHSENNSDLIQEVRRESALAGRESQECETYIKLADAAVKHPEFKDTVHPSKQAALAALAILEKRPTMHPHADRLSQLYVEELATLAKEPDQNELIKLGANYIGTCAPFVTYAHLPLLFADEKKYAFNSDEHARVMVQARAIITEQAGVPLSIITRAVQITILQKFLQEEYSGPNKAELMLDAQAYLDQFEADRKTIAAHYAEKREKFKVESVLYREYEQEIMKKMAEGHGAIVRRVFPGL